MQKSKCLTYLLSFCRDVDGNQSERTRNGSGIWKCRRKVRIKYVKNLLIKSYHSCRMLSIFFQRMFQIWYHPDVIFYNSPLGHEFNKNLKEFIRYTDKVNANFSLLIYCIRSKFVVRLSLGRRRRILNIKNGPNNFQKHKLTK